jgi:type I restriction enzyme R subunit
VKALEEKVSMYIKIRDVVRAASGDYIDLKAYDPDMRHLIDTYLSANPSKVLSSFGDMTLINLLVEKGTAYVKELPANTKKEQSAVAETIENNVIKEIVEKMQTNPKYYEKMSILLKELVDKRKREVIGYQEYLEKIVELSKNVVRPEESMSYPDEIKSSRALMALYDNLDQNVDYATDIHEAVIESLSDGFRGNIVKERQIKRAIRRVVTFYLKLNDPECQEEVDRIFKIVSEQDEY